MKLTRGESIFIATNYFVLSLITLIIMIPFWYVLCVSVTPYSIFSEKNGLVLFPTSLSFDYFAYLLKKGSLIYNAYGVTIRNTAAGVLLALLLTAAAAYSLAEKKLPGRRIIMLIFVFTMLFKGGLIPTYITIKNLGLLNTDYVLILVMAFSAFNMIIMKSFFEGIPDSLKESAAIDGASEIRTLRSIVLPMSMPVIASIGLLYMVTYWNDFFNALLYVTDWHKAPVQLVLRTIIASSSLPPELLEAAGRTPPPTIGIQMAAIVIVALPMMVLYPFIQKYFEQGMLIGSVKG
ncbi:MULTISPECIES: carbohydrate ABC transporter permease [Paenibacillus]|uniref:Multiple sugar transport system permease protein/putative aldouronate transport system permease protein n=1 Tax=Paenibacillus favisporus TaxID=221028 RepID=A0ABV2EY39_9BACL|nr:MULTISPECIES: carbohydrate ABC transporter permease [Paenibacillus]MBJ9992919.1 carbohydrate ABC transporter permease [Paenibacillus sp. S28]MEC0177195.1 carbohydrate ABC transporter permease [Paenibacillus favisporus]PQP88305.1 ABC transporter permease [Paenibacillus sp. AR247]